MFLINKLYLLIKLTKNILLGYHLTSIDRPWRTKSELDLIIFKSILNKVKNECCSAKIHHLHGMFHGNKSLIELWNNRQLRVAPSRAKRTPSYVSDDLNLFFCGRLKNYHKTLKTG